MQQLTAKKLMENLNILKDIEILQQLESTDSDNNNLTHIQNFA